MPKGMGVQVSPCPQTKEPDAERLAIIVCKKRGRLETEVRAKPDFLQKKSERTSGGRGSEIFVSLKDETKIHESGQVSPCPQTKEPDAERLALMVVVSKNQIFFMSFSWKI